MRILKKIKQEKGVVKGCLAVAVALLLGFGWKLPVKAAVTQTDLAKPVVDKTTHNQKGPEKHIEVHTVHPTIMCISEIIPRGKLRAWN